MSTSKAQLGVFLLMVVTFLLAQPHIALAQQGGNDSAAKEADGKYNVIDKIERLEQLDRLDALEFKNQIDTALMCLREWNFSCAEEHLKEAKWYVTKPDDFKVIDYIRNYAEFERRLSKAQECLDGWNFSCAESYISDASYYAEDKKDVLYVSPAEVERRLSRMKDSLFSKKQEWWEMATNYPNIEVVDTWEYNNAWYIRTKVWTKGVPKADVVITVDLIPEVERGLFGGTYSHHQVMVYEWEEGSSFRAQLRSAIPRAAPCLITVEKYRNELYCPGHGTLASKSTYEPRLSFTSIEIAENIARYYIKEELLERWKYIVGY